ncbi:hypothetical protein AB0H73_14735 [Streptomyces olivoreticuli]
MTNPPEPVLVPPVTGPSCRLCGVRAAVHWQRRLTDGEFAAHLEFEQQRRDRITLLADPDGSAPVFGPMPAPGDCTTPVFACASHAITLDAAALIHAKSCTAPDAGDLPGCDCTPEPAPEPDSDPHLTDLPDVLPPGWSARG